MQRKNLFCKNTLVKLFLFLLYTLDLPLLWMCGLKIKLSTIAFKANPKMTLSVLLQQSPMLKQENLIICNIMIILIHIFLPIYACRQ